MGGIPPQKMQLLFFILLYLYFSSVLALKSSQDPDWSGFWFFRSRDITNNNKKMLDIKWDETIWLIYNKVEARPKWQGCTLTTLRYAAAL